MEGKLGEWKKPTLDQGGAAQGDVEQAAIAEDTEQVIFSGIGYPRRPYLSIAHLRPYILPMAAILPRGRCGKVGQSIHGSSRRRRRFQPYLVYLVVVRTGTDHSHWPSALSGCQTISVSAGRDVGRGKMLQPEGPPPKYCLIAEAGAVRGCRCIPVVGGQPHGIAKRGRRSP